MDKSVLDYTNEAVLKRYILDFKKDPEFAQLVFSGFLKWFYVLGRLKSENINVPMTASTIELDHMWHTFLLFTKDYKEFCHKYFGRFIHHIPASENDEKISEQQSRKSFKRYLDIMVEEFGEGLVFKWYKDNIYA